MAVPATAIVKFGSTSTTMLVAARLDQPQFREQRLFRLFEPGGFDELYSFARDLGQTSASRGLQPLAAGGEAFRLHPHWEQKLKVWFPRWWHLSAQEEGRLAWLAVKAERPYTDVVIDIGGGSTEIVSHHTAWSISQGAARPSFSLVDAPDLREFHHPVFIGGTAVSLATWAKRHILVPQDIADLQCTLQTGRADLPQWDSVRLKILPAGLALMSALIERSAFTQFEVSQRGLTEGLWLAASLGRGGY